MVFERSPCMAFLFLLALLLSAVPCQADLVGILAVESPAVGPLIAILAGDSPASPEANVSTAELMVPYPVVFVSDSPPNDMGISYIPRHVVTGTIYTVSAGERRPWADGRLRVYVNGAQATVDGAAYSATIIPADEVEVTLVHDCGYLLGMSAGIADPSGGPTRIDVEAQALEISGDVYSDGRPADGACLFVYLNDQPVGPIHAASGQGPMFTVSIPGGHPGDRVSITASKNDRSGIVSQDVSDHRVFLTVNLKDMATYLPYTDSAMPFREKPKKSRLMAMLRRSR